MAEDKMRKRIEEGQRLLRIAESWSRANKASESYDADEHRESVSALEKHMLDNAHFFLRDLPRRIEELEEALKYYADTFCELGPYHECCGRLTSDECSGCRAASILSQTETPVGEMDDSGRTFIAYNNRVSDTPPHTHGDVERVARAMYDARCAGKKNYCDFDDLSTNGYHDTYEVFMADAAAALSAMRPVSVDAQKLAESDLRAARALCVYDDVDPDAVYYDRTGQNRHNYSVVLGEAEAAIKAYLTAIAEEGYVIVPRELDHKNMDHWEVASAGILAIEEFGGELGSDHTPERQIADAYRDMISAMISKAEQGEG